MKKILVTGSGGIGGVNFVRALRVIDEKFFIVGTDFNQYHLEFPDVDIRVRTPRHSDHQFIPLIKKIVAEHSIDFIHPKPSSESLVISEDTELKQKTFLPNSSIISYDKLTTQKTLFENNIPVAKTKTLSSIDELQSCFENFSGGPLMTLSINRKMFTFSVVVDAGTTISIEDSPVPDNTVEPMRAPLDTTKNKKAEAIADAVFAFPGCPQVGVRKACIKKKKVMKKWRMTCP